MRLGYTGALALFLSGVSPFALAAENTSGVNDGSSYPAPVTQQAPDQPSGTQTTGTTGSGDASSGLQGPPGSSPGTVPSTMSESIAAADSVPIMARPLPLNDAQRRQIFQRVKGAGGPVANTTAKPADELPASVEMHELPADIERDIPALRGLKYVLADNKVLIVAPANRIVIGEITQ